MKDDSAYVPITREEAAALFLANMLGAGHWQHLCSLQFAHIKDNIERGKAQAALLCDLAIFHADTLLDRLALTDEQRQTTHSPLPSPPQKEVPNANE